VGFTCSGIKQVGAGKLGRVAFLSFLYAACGWVGAIDSCFLVENRLHRKAVVSGFLLFFMWDFSLQPWRCHGFRGGGARHAVFLRALRLIASLGAGGGPLLAVAILHRWSVRPLSSLLCVLFSRSDLGRINIAGGAVCIHSHKGNELHEPPLSHLSSPAHCLHVSLAFSIKSAESASSKKNPVPISNRNLDLHQWTQ
jgi:hypothetical protein